MGRVNKYPDDLAGRTLGARPDISFDLTGRDRDLQQSFSHYVHQVLNQIQATKNIAEVP